MEGSIRSSYRGTLWEVYSRAVSLVSVVGVVVAFVIGGYDLLELSFPRLTLESSLHEKYRNNESYTKFGTFHENLSEEEVTRQRIINYEQLLRMERRSARQSLLKVGLGLLALTILNGPLALFYWSKRVG